MGPTHALSGAALWLGGLAIARSSGVEISTEVALVSTAVCAGSAMLNDIDEPESTIARTFGPVSQLISVGVNKTSAGIYNLTQGPRDQQVTDGHRGITHTVLGALITGSLVSALTGIFGKPAILITFFITFGLAIRGLLADTVRQYGWIGITGITIAATAGAYALLPQEANLWWLGLPVAIGMILHDLGDMITKEGAPLLAPLVPIRGKRWWEFALPSLLRIRAGGAAEYGLYGTLFTVILIVSAAAVFADANVFAMMKEYL